MSDKIRRNRERLQAKLPKDCRTDAANAHVASLHEFPIEEVRRSLLKRHTYDVMYDSFLAGWDAAMQVQLPELLDEHMDLHGKVMDMTIDQMRVSGEIEG